LPTLEQPNADAPYAKGHPSGVLDVLIVGAGFSGLGMAIKLLQQGNKDFLVIEKADDIGGTWYANQYPGCACDIPSHLLRKRLAGTVWESGGCRSWYQDAQTRESPVIWPGSVVAYMRGTRAVAERDYVLSSGKTENSNTLAAENRGQLDEPTNSGKLD
jgi:hypothetical protein